jgi:DNA-binding beta-propeller fold protein YncE
MGTGKKGRVMRIHLLNRRFHRSVGTVAFILALAVAVVVPTTASAAGGDRQWVSRYDGPVHGSDHPSSVAVSLDGTRVFVTGYSSGIGHDFDYGTVAYDVASGAKVWAKRYDGPGNGDDIASDLALSPDGATVYITGQSPGKGTMDDYATVAYDAATGAKVWLSRFNGPGNGQDVALRLAASADGVFVTGYSPGPGTFDYLTICYDAVTGAQVWAMKYNGPGNSYDYPNAVGVSPDGTRVFVTGPSLGIRANYASVAYDAATGAKLWVRRHPGANAVGLAVSPDGSTVYVTGYGYEGDARLDDYVTLAYDTATGATAWVRRYNGPPSSYDLAGSIFVSPDGARVYVTGESGGTGTDYDYATVAYDAVSGHQAWVARYDGPVSGEDAGTFVTVSPDGSEVYVTGQSTGNGTGLDYATLAYDAVDGDKMWVRRYDGIGHAAEYANAIAVSPDGARVVITGQSVGVGGFFDDDYATIAYATS